MKCFVCNKWIIFDLEAAIGYHGRIIHEQCRVGAVARSILTGVLWILVALFLTLLFAGKVKAEEIYPEKEWVPGKLVHAIDMDGRCICRPFVKVGDADDDFMGIPQVVGFHGDNIQYDREQRIIWERYPAERFVLPNALVAHIGHRMCKLHK